VVWDCQGGIECLGSGVEGFCLLEQRSRWESDRDDE
ncbi:hypothetical protein Tco_1289421, partial [Tanacetum coccineum]